MAWRRSLSFASCLANKKRRHKDKLPAHSTAGSQILFLFFVYKFAALKIKHIVLVY